MCGIAGLVAADSSGSIDRLTERLIHRGPDGRGIWTSECGWLSLGHRRLSIIDLRSVGAQPMQSRCGRYVIAFNGEIYNYRELSNRLTNHPWRSDSDTEVLLETIAKLGVSKTLRLLNGMFAFALYDMHTQELHLACDRLGEKPLYYGRVGSDFVFASELKAITCHPAFSNPVDRGSLALFLRYNYVPAPHSIYEGIQKLEPSQHVILELRDGKPQQVSSCFYWSSRDVAANGISSPLNGSEKQLLDGLENRIQEAVTSRMVSDVPLGAFLSGGYDSTLVVSIMQANSTHPVKTFSIGQQDQLYDEAAHARGVADYLGTEHTEWILSSDDALHVIPQLAAMYCEPFADASQIPTYLVSKITRQHVTVALSGDGGDELFGGYNRHFRAGKLWKRMQPLPTWLRKILGGSIRSLSATQWDQLYGKLSFLLGRRGSLSLPGTKLHKLAGSLRADSARDLYRRLASVNQLPLKLLQRGREHPGLVENFANDISGMQFEELMMYLDMVTYLPGDILTKLDRATMATSLETRVPLLDHRLVEHAWRLPLSMKVRHGEGKWALKQIVHRHVPKELMDRPKMGFSIPLSRWLRGPLQAWAEKLLDRDRIESEGYFDGTAVRKLWMEHLTGKHEREHQVWSVLMFQSWNALR